jgi:hypothetical protein
MKPERMPPDVEPSGLLDRLVCGELDQLSRGRMLQWLEADPRRWRAVGLAFLEAQTWSHALEEWPLREMENRVPVAEARSERSRLPAGRDGLIGRTESVPVSSEPSRQPRKAIRRAVIAAAVVVAFGLGLALRDFVDPLKRPHDRPVAGGARTGADDHSAGQENRGAPRADEPVLASLDVQAGGRFGVTAPIRIPVAPAGSDIVEDQTARRLVEIPEYVRQQLERRGFKLSFERRYVFARLPDGRQVALPVEQIHVNPVPISIN